MLKSFGNFTDEELLSIAIEISVSEDKRRVGSEPTAAPPATPDPTRWRNGTERCPMPPAVTVPPSGVEAGDANRAFCVVWANEYPDEAGFRVEVRYHEGGERFVHTIGPGEHDFVFPAGEEPIRAGAECMARRSYTIQVFVLRPGGDEPVGAVGAVTECGR